MSEFTEQQLRFLTYQVVVVSEKRTGYLGSALYSTKDIETGENVVVVRVIVPDGDPYVIRVGLDEYLDRFQAADGQLREQEQEVLG